MRHGIARGDRTGKRKKAIKNLLGKTPTEGRPVMRVNSGSEVQNYGGATRRTFGTSELFGHTPPKKWRKRRAKKLPEKQYHYGHAKPLN